MFKLLKHLKPVEWAQSVAVLLFALLQIWFDYTMPDFMARITRLVQTPGSPVGEIWRAGVYMILFALGSLACVIIISFFASQVSAALASRLRGMVYDKVASFSEEDINSFTSASLITRSTNDITQLQTFFMAALQMLLKVPFLVAGGIIKIAGMNYQWTLATAASIVLIAIVVTIVMAVVLPEYRKMQSLVDRQNLTIRESLTGRHIVRAYNAEVYQTAKSERANEAFTATDLKTNRTMVAMSPFNSIATNGLNIAVYIIGAYLIMKASGAGSALTIFSDIVVFSSYIAVLMSAVKFITKVLPRIPRASVSAGRVNEVLDAEPAIKDGTLSVGTVTAAPAAHGEATDEAAAYGAQPNETEAYGTGAADAETDEITLNNVSFRYPGASNNTLENVSFSVRRGETVGFIGSTGSGKSTLLSLLMRFYDITEGEILFRGVDIKQYIRKKLYNIIGYAPQKAVLFKGTVKSNIAYGDNGAGGYSDEDVENAAGIAQAQEFVRNMEGGYGAAIAQGGSNLSGGQRQRLCLARAFCRQPEIYIFDDSYSALDYKTERSLRSSLRSDTHGATRLIVAQRISSIMDADRIIVLEDGRVAGQGSHRELLKECSVYREIAESQLSEEELAR